MRGVSLIRVDVVRVPPNLLGYGEDHRQAICGRGVDTALALACDAEKIMTYLVDEKRAHQQSERGQSPIVPLRNYE